MSSDWKPKIGDRVKLLRTSEFADQAPENDIGIITGPSTARAGAWIVQWSISGYRNRWYEPGVDIVPHLNIKVRMTRKRS